MSDFEEALDETQAEYREALDGLGDRLCECKQIRDSFACKIRHLHFDTSWTKGDH